MRLRAAVALVLLGSLSRAEPPAAPQTRRDDVKEVLHGVTLVDPYRWLEDGASPETRAWIDTQNRYTESVLAGGKERASVHARLTELTRYGSRTVCQRRGDRLFFRATRPTDALPILYVREGERDEVLLDPHGLSADHTVSVTVEDITDDGRLMLYGVRRGGEDEVELRVRDVATRQDLPDVLPRALYRGGSLQLDGRAFFYGVQDRAAGVRIRRHVIGTAPAEDTEVFGAGYGPGQWISADVSENGRHLLITVQHGWARNEIWVQDLPAAAPPRAVVKDVDAHFRAAFAGDLLIAQTDWQAPRGRIVEIDLASPAPERWRTIVPQGDAAIQGFGLAGGKLLVHALADVASRLQVYALDGRALGNLPLPGPGAVAALQTRFADDDVYFAFNSYTAPAPVYRGRIGTLAIEPWWRPEVPWDAAAYETEQVWYPSKDGTRVPMFVTHRRGLARAGRAPALLYGYGGFDVSLLPSFHPLAAWLLEQGGVLAVPALRGGGEFGQDWHRAGMLEKKQNVFDDFIAAGEWLVANRYTSRDRLAIRGASNGGLLVGAALTQRPDLFRAVLCEVPDLDMIGYPRFPNHNPPALLEYGDARKPDEFRFLLAYSPYQRVTAGTAYPAVLFTTGDKDTRVPPLQARKMTARLQAATSSGRPVLLRYDANAGHSGGRPAGKLVDDLALQAAFLARELDLGPR